jgi:alpha-L-fucosidase
MNHDTAPPARQQTFDAVRVQDWEELDSRQLPEWYGDAKFGIFVHWGVFSVPAWRTLNDEQFGSYAEWYYASVYGPYRNADPDFHATMFPGRDYRDLVSDFRAELFDPEAWANLFRRAGARYVVLTSKHHDGFCLWPTENPHKQGWHVGEAGPGRDLLGELTNAVRDQGLRMGLYYSIPEWETHRSHRVDGGYFIPEADAQTYGMSEEAYPHEILHQQWVELNEKYAPAVIYTDGGEWDFSEEYTETRRCPSLGGEPWDRRVVRLQSGRVRRGLRERERARDSACPDRCRWRESAAECRTDGGRQDPHRAAGATAADRGVARRQR